MLKILLNQHFFKTALLISLLTNNIALAYCQDNPVPGDSIKKLKIATDIVNADSTTILPDSTATDTIAITKPKSKNALDSKVEYHAKDSMRFDLSLKKLYLFGVGEIKYKSITLQADYIEMDLNTNIVFATGTKDSLGKDIGNPVFEEGGQKFTSKELTFNFDTKKGLIKDVITQEGDGYIHGESVKKMQNDELYIKNGLYTTCENPDPHFAIHASKLKVIPDNKIITGPAYLMIEDVPTPLAVPFGFFPNKKGQSSGILIPTYGENNLGFFLNDGGYYLGISEWMDLALRGDIYSKGSWGLKGTSNYKKRYKYDGLFDANYSNIITGQREFPDHVLNKSFLVRWNHRQDAKARPGSVFSANVNAGTSNYNQLNSVASTNYLNNTMQSNISYSKSFSGKLPSNLGINARHSQNTISKTLSLTLPEVLFTVNRFFPFKKGTTLGEQKWYEKIGVTTTHSAKNEINTYDSLFFKPESLDQFRHGIMHNANASTSFKILKFFALNPNISYTERWYLQTIEKRWDNEAQSLITDTLTGFKRAGEYSFSTSLNTKLYGMYQFKRTKIQGIRHVLTPSVNLTYKPDFTSQRYGYFKPVTNITATDTTTVLTPENYSIYDIGIFGKPSAGEQGLVTFNLINNLEMKVKSDKDTLTGFKKIKIFETLNFSATHNVFAETFKWSGISIAARTRLFNNIDINFNALIDPYALDTTGGVHRIDEFEWDKTGNFGRLTNADLSLNFNFRSKEGLSAKKTSTAGTEEELATINANPDYYVDFNIPWSLSVALVLNYSKPLLEPKVIQTINFYGDLNLTPKWKIGYNANYDFDKKEFTYVTLNIYRDLHCWEMRFDYVPFGANKSYNLAIKVKPGTLQDLKLNRKSNWQNN